MRVRNNSQGGVPRYLPEIGHKENLFIWRWGVQWLWRVTIDHLGSPGPLH